MIRSATLVRRLCQVDDDSPEARCAFCNRRWLANRLETTVVSLVRSRVVADGATAQGVRLPDHLIVLAF